jgi:hypothetical protein
MNHKTFNSLESIKLIDLPFHKAENGILIVIEENIDIPIEIKRVFTVVAEKGAIRGQHAHKKCSQFLTCPRGYIEVECDDGINKLNYKLNSPNFGILIPPGVWGTQIYREAHSVLNVICDLGYDPNDYIIDYEIFKKYKNYNK